MRKGSGENMGREKDDCRGMCSRRILQCLVYLCIPPVPVATTVVTKYAFELPLGVNHSAAPQGSFPNPPLRACRACGTRSAAR